MNIWPATADIELPTPPEGWQLVGWYGLLLVLPEAWNLVRHSGESDGGAMGFSSLQDMQLELRWRSFRFRNARRYERKILSRLADRQVKLTILPEQADGLTRTRVDLDQGVVVLVRSRRRLYELSWPSQAEWVDEIARGMRDYVHLRVWPWGAYGALGIVPRTLKVKKLKLVPGAVMLDFARRGRRVVVGSWSMAERLLAGGTLEDFALERVPLVKNNPRGTWRKAGRGRLYTVNFRTAVLKLRRSSVLYLEHLPEINMIRWVQRSGPPRDEPRLGSGLPER
jgi:hypothetical protein